MGTMDGRGQERYIWVRTNAEVQVIAGGVLDPGAGRGHGEKWQVQELFGRGASQRGPPELPNCETWTKCGA